MIKPMLCIGRPYLGFSESRTLTQNCRPRAGGLEQWSTLKNGTILNGSLCLAAPSRMLLLFAAFLALPIPAAQAAGCTAYDFWEKPSELRYIMVPDNNFIGDTEPTVYSDEKCEQPAKEYDKDASIAGGHAFAGSARQAMEICEINMDRTVASVLRRVKGFPGFYCLIGEHQGPKRQRRHVLFFMKFNGNKKKALNAAGLLRATALSVLLSRFDIFPISIPIGGIAMRPGG